MGVSYVLNVGCVDILIQSFFDQLLWTEFGELRYTLSRQSNGKGGRKKKRKREKNQTYFNIQFEILRQISALNQFSMLNGRM